MNKYLLAILLFLLAVVAVALDQTDFEPILAKEPLNITQGVKLSQQPSWDFKGKYHPANWLMVEQNVYMPIEPHSYAEPYKTWYNTDFASNPFDGQIEIAIVGEPLPSPRATFLIVAITAGIIMWSRSKLKPISE